MKHFNEIETLKRIRSELDEALNYLYEQDLAYSLKYRELKKRYRIIDKAIKKLERLAK